MTSASDRQRTLALLTDAVASGARRLQASVKRNNGAHCSLTPRQTASLKTPLLASRQCSSPL
jgi:hypothetical protein